MDSLELECVRFFMKYNEELGNDLCVIPRLCEFVNRHREEIIEIVLYNLVANKLSIEEQNQLAVLLEKMLIDS